MKRLVLFSFLLSIFFAKAQSETELRKRFNELDSAIRVLGNSDLSKVLGVANEQVKIAEQLQDDSLIFHAHYWKAESFKYLGMFDEALAENYLLLERLKGKRGDRRTATTLFDIGSNFIQMSDYKNAIIYFERAKRQFIQLGSFADTIQTNFDIGLALVGLEKFDEGVALMQQNLKAAKATTDTTVILIGLENLMYSYHDIGDFANALKYRTESLNYIDYINHEITQQIAMNLSFSEIHIGLKDYDKAQDYLTRAIALAKEFNTNEALMYAYKNQAVINEAKGNFENALTNFKEYVLLKDSIYKSNYDTKMSSMANLYELKHKQNEIQHLSEQQQISSAKIRQLYLVFAAFILFVLVVFLMLQIRKNKAENLLKEKFAAQLLHAQEEERQRISKELHDSVGQNLLFIKNQIQGNEIDNDKLLKSVDAGLSEIRSITKNLYPNQLEKYGLVAAVEALAEEVKNTTGIFVSSDMEGIDEVLNKNVRINFYRIIQEFVNNTLKHAEATSIRITAAQTGNEIRLTVQDNGKGFDKQTLSGKSNSSFGLLNMEERVKMLKGKFDIETEPGKGTKSIFTIPV